jgi:hypothetical protein
MFASKALARTNGIAYLSLISLTKLKSLLPVTLMYKCLHIRLRCALARNKLIVLSFSDIEKVSKHKPPSLKFANKAVK